MPKVYGIVGYRQIVEDTTRGPGITSEQLIEKPACMLLTRIYKQTANPGEVVDGMRLGNNVSIIADPFAYENYANIAYVRLKKDGVRWKVEGVSIAYPRLNLSIGGVWNGQSSIT